IAVLIAGIGGIAWVAQYLPGRGRNVQVKPVAAGRDAVQFAHTKAVWPPPPHWWDPKDDNYKPYIAEFELGQDGHYDFEFTNTEKADVEFGVAETNCVCSGVHVAVFQSTAQKEAYEKARKGGAPTAGDALAWTKVDMDKDLRKTITVPAGASGVVRIGW